MRFKKPVSDMHQENEVIFGNLLDASELPDLPIYHTINKPVHFVMSVMFGLVFLVIGAFGLLSIPVFWAQSPNTPCFDWGGDGTGVLVGDTDMFCKTACTSSALYAGNL